LCYYFLFDTHRYGHGLFMGAKRRTLCHRVK
jgi:hypothetical protein